MKEILDALLAKSPDGIDGQFVLKTTSFVGAVRRAQLEGVPADTYEAAVQMDTPKGKVMTRVYFRGEDLVLIALASETSAIATPPQSGLVIPGGLRRGN